MGSGVSNLVSGISVFLAGLLPAGCHHQAAPVKSVADATNTVRTVAADPNRRDLGELTLTNHTETCVQFGGGKDCVLRPKMTDEKNAEITLTFETRTPDGKLQSMNVAQTTAQIGKPVQLAFGDFQLTFTPNVVSQ